MNPRAAMFAIVAALMLAGCAVPAPTAGPAPSPALSSREHTLERDWRARATALTREQRWAEARVQLELLQLLDPAAADYRTQLESVRRTIAGVAAEAHAQAAAARRRGDLDAATTQYLRALAADRDDAAAAQGLREIERERVRRAWLNRPPRSMPNGAAGKPAEMEPEYVQHQKNGNGDAASPRR